jgi:two-component system LytT family sensor kinase
MEMKPETLRPIIRAYGLSIVVWCGLSLLTGWQYRIFDEELNIHSSLFDMVLLAESRGFAFALLTPPIFYLARRHLSGARDRFRYVLVYCLGVGPFMLLYACIRWVVLPPWDAALQQYVPRSAHGPLELIHQGFADQITMYIAIVVAAHAYQYFERVRKQEVEKYEFQRALAASELQALKMQLHPHFLFNTLHGISTLIDTDQRSAKSIVLKLSSLLRRTLEHSSSDLIPLREELKFVHEYLDLEQVRLGTRLTVDWLIGPDTQQILVPQLILQPLVENSVRHGIACSRDGGWIEIKSQRLECNLELRIRNSVGGKRTPGMGVGLKNTDARLRYLYSDEATFAFAEALDQTATATIVLPALGSSSAADPDTTNGIEKDEGNHAHLSRG